jgi:O-antigen ligase
VEELIFIPFVLNCMLRAIRGDEVTFAWGTRQNILLIFFAFIPVSMLAGLSEGLDASYGDLNQLIRLSKYIFVYTIAVSYIHLYDDIEVKRKRLTTVVIVCSVLASIIATQQFFDVFGLNSVYVKYVAPTQYETLLGDYPFPRPVGMVGNPNEFGFVFVIGAIVSSYRLIKDGGWIFMAATMINLVSVGLTLSRTSLVALVVGVGYIYGMQVFVRDRGIGQRLKYLALPTGVLVVVVGYVLANPVLYETIGWRFYSLLEFESTSSWQVRQQTWQKNMQLFMESPIIGVGPLRRAASTVGAADNEWLLLLRTYGVTGTLFLIVGIIWPHLRAKSGLLRVFVTGMLISTAIYMIPAGVFYSLSLMPLLLILLAMEDPTTHRFTVAKSSRRGKIYR